MEASKGRRITIRLSGGGPWGFRLEGNPEQGFPLTVSKVRAKSKAYNILFEGDIVVSVNCMECTSLTYDQAMDIMDDATSDLTLDIIRCNSDDAQEDIESNRQSPFAKTEPTENYMIIEELETVQYERNDPPAQKQLASEEEIDVDNVTNEILPKSVQHSSMNTTGQDFTTIPANTTTNGTVKDESSWKNEDDVEYVDESRDLDEASDLEEEIVAACEQMQADDTTDREESLDIILEDATTVDTSREDTWEGIANDGILKPEQKLGQHSKSEEEPIVNSDDALPSLPPDDTVVGTLDPALANKNISNHITTGTQPEVTVTDMGSTDHMFRVSKISSSNVEVWNPFGASQYISRNPTTTSTTSSTTTSQTLLGNNLKQAPVFSPRSPPPPAPPLPSSNHRNQRPLSMPTFDLNGIDHVESQRPLSAELDPKLLWKVLQPPPPEEMEAINLVRRSKGKMFSSSSFYDEPGHIYPTVEEQVELCKKISQSLSADTNKQSKGSTMYIKRMKKSHKWIFEGPDPEEMDEPVLSPAERRDRAPISAPTTNYVPDQSRPKLKLVLDPRQLKDAMKLRGSGLYNEHNVVSPEICFDLVKDLNSPTGKGAALFAKRKKKSEKWVVDEETVKEHEHKHNVQLQQLPTFRLDTGSPDVGRQMPENKLSSKLDELQDMLSHPRLKLVKSPWEAALESPIGSCDAAFQVVMPSLGRALGGTVANASIRKSHTFSTPTLSSYQSAPRSFSPAQAPPPPVPSPSPAPTPAPASVHGPPPPPPRATPSTLSPHFDIYKPRAPRVWTGQSSDTSSGRISAEPLQNSVTTDNYFPSQINSNLSSLYNRNQSPNFNTLPRAWGSSNSDSQFSFRPVKAPTLLY